MRTIGHENVRLTDGFFADVRKKNAQVSLKNIYKRFAETGRFSALDCIPRDPPSHIFYDSDVAKWLEAAAYLLKDYRDGDLLGIVHETVRKPYRRSFRRAISTVFVRSTGPIRSSRIAPITSSTARDTSSKRRSRSTKRGSTAIFSPP